MQSLCWCLARTLPAKRRHTHSSNAGGSLKIMMTGIYIYIFYFSHHSEIWYIKVRLRKHEMFDWSFKINWTTHKHDSYNDTACLIIFMFWSFVLYRSNTLICVCTSVWTLHSGPDVNSTHLLFEAFFNWMFTAGENHEIKVLTETKSKFVLIRVSASVSTTARVVSQLISKVLQSWFILGKQL